MYDMIGVRQSVVVPIAKTIGPSMDGRSRVVRMMDERPLASGLEASLAKASALVFLERRMCVNWAARM